MKNSTSFSLSKHTSAKLLNRIGLGFIWLVALSLLVVIISLLYFILHKGLSGLSFKFLVDLPEDMDVGGGIGPFLFNSLYVLVLSLVFSIPIGLFGGIFLSEYAPDNRFTNLVRISVESLATVPSIVFGLFGFVLFVEYFDIGLTIVGASITLAFLNLPILTRITEEAVSAVPFELREASYALGGTQSRTILTVLLPAALNGIMTGISLVACRAFGESAIILLAGGSSSSGFMWDFNLLSQGGTLPVHLWYIQSEALVEDAKQIADRSAAVLIIVVLLISLLLRIPLFLQRSKHK
ncbi:phosphate ABC transporter permease PstA [Priestia koreensis]|uniref:Phosphate transport system permease protein PstA n=1 Tax=Priestia koreensis TaxID=284581 RepID=A0A0M0L7Y4_9BACI|nr:phosphate ABC transporter permease PstA [Priestia koreensis]KOO46778.1 phosphate ABC transporter permease [Priestia koreensis]